jgi:hypothetical protein
VPIRALITIRDLDATVLEGPSALVDVPAASPGSQEPIVAASIVSPPSGRTIHRLSHCRSPYMRDTPTRADRYLISCCPLFWRSGSSGLFSHCHHSTFGRDAPSGADCFFIGYCHLSLRTGMLYSLITLVFLLHCLAHPLFLQNLNLSEHLAFDPASIGSAILEADDPHPDSTSTANRVLHMKNLLSGPIDALIQDSSTVKQNLDEVNS